MNAQIIDNPMYTGAGYYEPDPDFVCPTCGSQWWKEDMTSYTVSSSRLHCQDCIDKLDTAENRQKWFVQNDAHYASLLAVYFLGAAAKEHIVDGVDSKKYVEMAFLTDPDGYHDALYDYIHSNDVRHSEYRQWLMETN